MCVTVPNIVKICQTVAEISQCNSIFQDGGCPPSWIRCARIRTTHDEYLVVFIIVQNLVAIDVVVLIMCHFQYFARLG